MEMLEQLKDIIVNYVEVKKEDIKPESRFMEDLGFSSFDFMSMLGEVEDELEVEIDQEEAANIRTVQEAPTGTAVIYVNARGDNSIVVVGGANNFCSVAYLQEHDLLFQQAEYIMLQMEIPYDAVFYAIRRASELKKTVILNPAPAPDTLPEEIWEKVDYITPNETELLRLSGQKEMSMEAIHAGADRLLARGVGHVLVTLGDKGVFYKDRREEWFCPTRTVTAVDTTAAGDCFNGAFVTALAEGHPIRQAAEFANIAASIAVTRKGAQKSIPLRSEVDALISL